MCKKFFKRFKSKIQKKTYENNFSRLNFNERFFFKSKMIFIEL